MGVHVVRRRPKSIVSCILEGQIASKANTAAQGSLFLSKISGGPISEEEAHRVLAQFGAIEKVWYNTQTDKEMFRLPEGIWVMFAYFQDCRDAQAVCYKIIVVKVVR